MRPLLQELLAPPVRLFAVGDELLRGEVADRNSSILALRLSVLGQAVESITQVSDRGDLLLSAVRRWRAEGGTLVVGGGLGPTADDLTREIVAEGLAVALAPHPAAVAMIRAREDRLEHRYTDFTHRQAQLPVGCEPIENPVGTAPGFWMPHPNGRGFLLVLPGVPAEFQAIVEYCFPGPGELQAENWQLLGLGEDRLAKLLDDHPDRDRLGFYPSLDGHRLRVPLDADRASLAECLADHLSSREGESPQAVVVRLLAEFGETLAVAESCTGGLLGARLTRVSGASDVFIGGVISYSDRMKEALLGVDPGLIRIEGAVSVAVARAMAEGARVRLGSDWALAITGIAGPGGERAGKPVGTLHVALAGPVGCEHRHLRGGWLREDNRRYAVLQALTMLWRALRRERP
jgi:nicotinamide-nucleotide amidase